MVSPNAGYGSLDPEWGTDPLTGRQSDGQVSAFEKSRIVSTNAEAYA
jgi:hypothetical protein